MYKVRKTKAFWIVTVLSLFAMVLIWHVFHSKKRLVILCLGDSLTADGYPTWLNQLISESQISARVINKGVKGHTSGEYLYYLKRSHLLEEIVPDIILLQLGTNDIRIDADHTPTKRFIQNMEQIIAEIQRHPYADRKTFKLLIATIPPLNEIGHLYTFNRESIRRVHEEINPAIKDIARKWNLILVDNYQHFLNHRELIPDVHPTEKGYHLMAENWIKSIKMALYQASNH